MRGTRGRVCLVSFSCEYASFVRLATFTILSAKHAKGRKTFDREREREREREIEERKERQSKWVCEKEGAT